MRIPNKYIRNRRFHDKHWNLIRSQSHPFDKLFCSSCTWHNPWLLRDIEEQIRDRFKWIEQQARALETGQPCFMNSPSGFRRLLNKKRKAEERTALAKIRNGDYGVEMPKFKRDADWLYW